MLRAFLQHWWNNSKFAVTFAPIYVGFWSFLSNLSSLENHTFRKLNHAQILTTSAYVQPRTCIARACSPQSTQSICQHTQVQQFNCTRVIMWLPLDTMTSKKMAATLWDFWRSVPAIERFLSVSTKRRGRKEYENVWTSLLLVLFSVILTRTSTHAIERLQTYGDETPWLTFQVVRTRMIATTNSFDSGINRYNTKSKYFWQLVTTRYAIQ